MFARRGPCQDWRRGGADHGGGSLNAELETWGDQHKRPQRFWLEVRQIDTSVSLTERYKKAPSPDNIAT